MRARGRGLYRPDVNGAVATAMAPSSSRAGLTNLDPGIEYGGSHDAGLRLALSRTKPEQPRSRHVEDGPGDRGVDRMFGGRHRHGARPFRVTLERAEWPLDQSLRDREGVAGRRRRARRSQRVRSVLALELPKADGAFFARQGQ